MPPQISRLRRWFALAAMALTLVAAGTYFYARHRLQNALKQVPDKIGVEFKQTAKGFSFSKSDQGRTLFKVEAREFLQFKLNGHAELRDVEITLYGRDSSRFDQIYGQDFEYDQKSGDVTSKGEVQIDLEANPQGLAKPDQAPPKELKNPIHLKTAGLTFNQKTGNASTKEKVEFSIPQARGSAVGVEYAANTNLLTLESQVNIVFESPASTLTASHGTITKNPRLIVLDLPRLQSGSRRSEADQATLLLRPDNTLERVLASGNVCLESAESKDGRPSQIRSTQLELLVAERGNVLRTATFSGDVQMVVAGTQSMQGSAGKAVLNFGERNRLTTVHTAEKVKLMQHQKSATSSATAQDFELTAPAVDFWLAGGNRLDHAETSGTAQIALRPGAPSQGQTLVTAGKFQAHFDAFGQLASIHGAPDARIVTSNPGQADRVSTSNILDAYFGAGAGIESIVQAGNLAYVDNERKAWADRARYTPADQTLVLSGAPRVIDGGMTTTARAIRMNRTTGDAFADGDVKSTFSDLKPQPGGGLLASSDPIHVTARSMVAHRNSANAVYTGDARLWQDANVVEASSIDFDRDHRSVFARGSPTQRVSTVLVQPDKSGKSTPVAITSERLIYADNERQAHFEGGVQAKGADLTTTAKQMDVFLQPRGQDSTKQSLAGTGKIDRIVARGQVVIIQPSRRATGDQLVYTSVDDKFVLTGGRPSIFDAERGKITGVSLTFFRADGRVLVEGSDTSPTVTQTRVAR